MRARRFLVLALLLSGAVEASMYVDLAGSWHVAPSEARTFEEATPPARDTSSWETLPLPDCRLSPGTGRDDPRAAQLEAGPCVWVRRVFTLDTAQAACQAVLRWEMIRWGFEAYLNGTHLGGTDLQGPGSLPVGHSALRAGDNELVLKVRTWKSLPRGGLKGWPLIPVGGSVFGWGGKQCTLAGEIGLGLFERFRVRSVMMRPSPRDSTVTAAVRVEAQGTTDSLSVHVRVRRPGTDTVLGEARTSAAAGKLGGKPLVIPVKLRSFDLWSPEKPVLTEAVVTVSGKGETHERVVQFGMRSFEARDRGFFLNGKPYTVLGSNVVTEWLWNREYYHNTDGALGRYLERARGMSVAAVRTHTTPPLHRVLRLCDSTGLMVLCEMPFTYNYQRVGFNKEEAEAYHGRGMAQSLGWIEELANHPSIVMWVSTNEPTNDIGDFDQTKWDNEVMIPAIKALDPTRPVLRSGEDSPDIQDIHCYDGFWGGAMGDYDETVRWRAETRDAVRPLGNTEYIEGFPPNRIHRWLGTRDRSEETDTYYAMVGMRQTEILRRLGYDLVLPYMMHGWTRGSWRPHAPTPMYGALRSALAPVAVSLDLNDRHKVVGDSLGVDVWVVNDRAESVSVRLSCYVCGRDPEFNPDPKAYASARRVHRGDLRLAARTRRTVRVTYKLPAAPGPAWVVALAEPSVGMAVVSQRQLLVQPRASVPGSVAKRTFRVVGADSAGLAWFRGHRMKVLEGIPYGRWQPDADMLVVWEDLQYAKRNLHLAEAISAFLGAGRKVLLMHQYGWRSGDWHWGFPNLPDGPTVGYTAVPHRSSLALPEDNAAARRAWKGLGRTTVSHLNGMQNAVCRDALSALPIAQTLPVKRFVRRPTPLSPKAIVVRCDSARYSTFIVDHHEPLHTLRAADGTLATRSLDRTLSSTPSLLCTMKAPDSAYGAGYEFTAPEEMDADVWVFEQGRAWSSPFAWRIGDSGWVQAGTDIAMAEWTSMADDGPTFAWVRLGTVKVTAGTHRLEVRVNAPRTNGLYLLSQDCFVLAPAGASAEVLARSGDGEPVMARLGVGEGEVLVTQVLLAERLPHKAASYDPVAERLMLNLLGY